jgi:hypothetical protein
MTSLGNGTKATGPRGTSVVETERGPFETERSLNSDRG